MKTIICDGCGRESCVVCSNCGKDATTTVELSDSDKNTIMGLCYIMAIGKFDFKGILESWDKAIVNLFR
jgi:hypothetical protein